MPLLPYRADMNSIARERIVARAGLIVRQVHVRWLIMLAVACGAIIVFFPFFWMAVTSLKTAPEIQRVPLQIAPDNWLNFSNYVEVFKREPFLRYLLNSAIVASIAAVSSVVVSSLAGFGFAKYRLPGTGRLLPRHRRHPDGPVPVGRGAALRLDERARAARYLHGHRGPGPGQRLRRLPDAAGHRDDSQRLHRRGPHRRLQRASNLLLW